MQSSESLSTIIQDWSLADLDSAVQTADLLRLCEGSIARDQYGELMKQEDADQEKLDAFALGALDGIVQARGGDPEVLALLVYLLAMADFGPGRSAYTKAKKMLSGLDQRQHSCFTQLGRETVMGMMEENPGASGKYAELLSMGRNFPGMPCLPLHSLPS